MKNKKNMYERIRSLEAAIKTFKEEGVATLDDAIWTIEDLRDRQRGPRRA